MNNQDIKDTIRKAAEEIPVPDSLTPKAVEKKIDGRPQKHPKLTFMGRRVLVAAASFVLLAVVGFGVLPKMTSLFPEDSDEIVVTEEYMTSSNAEASESKSTPEDYEELCKHIKNVNAVREYENKKNSVSYGSSGGAETDVAESTVSEDASSPFSENSSSETDNSYSETDLQVKGIMEADVVKTDGSCIYALSSTNNGFRVRIYSVNGTDVKKISTIKIKKSSCSEMYLEGKTLILLCSDWNNTDTGVVEESATEDDYTTGCYAYPPHQTTNIRFYDVSAPEKPQELRHMSQSGHYSTSRISDGYLYTFSNYYIYNSDLSTKELSKFVPQAADSYIPADKIRITSKDSTSYMVMTSLKISNPQDFTDSAALLGGGDTQYMNSNHIYTVENYCEKNTDRSIITKYTYEDGHFTYNGKAKVKGNLYDSYYMHEYNNNFVFVYTNYSEKTNVTTNGLCVLNDKMELIGKIKNLGINEEIYASYFIDNMAYFVTFRNTDPVFAVDVSNPKKPKLRSELKLPGFSSYLHSFGENMLLGIGNGSPHGDDTDYVKLSLFSIDKNDKLKEIDTVFPRQKYSTQHYADSNHKCVFVDEERGLAGLMIERADGYNDSMGEYVVYQEKDGALTKVLSCPIKTKEDSGIHIRGLRIGNYFYIVFPDTGEIKVYDMNTWKKAK